jgi:hypothetical protein
MDVYTYGTASGVRWRKSRRGKAREARVSGKPDYQAIMLK